MSEVQYPLVSVIVLSYQNGRYLTRCLDSIMKQDYPAIEIIVADDASDDFDSKAAEATREYIDTHKKKNIKNVQILTAQKNLGTVKNLRKALAVYQGDYYINLGANDLFAYDSVISDYMFTFRMYGYEPLIVCAQCAKTDSELNVTGYHMTFRDKLDLLSRDAKRLFSRLSHRCLLISLSSCYRRDFGREVDAYNTAYKYSEDMHTFQRMARKGIVPVYMDKCTVLHVEGGIANNSGDYPIEVVEQFYKDKQLMFKREILPYLDELLPEDKKAFLERLQWERRSLTKSRLLALRKRSPLKILAFITRRPAFLFDLGREVARFSFTKNLSLFPNINATKIYVALVAMLAVLFVFSPDMKSLERLFKESLYLGIFVLMAGCVFIHVRKVIRCIRDGG